MSNMPHLRFSNTSDDLQDCIDALDRCTEKIEFPEQYADNLECDPKYAHECEISEVERSSMEEMYDQCNAYTRLFNDLEKAEKGIRF